MIDIRGPERGTTLAVKNSHSLTDQTQERIRKEILTYLAATPRKLHQDGDHASAELALSLGNLLLWIHSLIAPGEPHLEQPLHETAQNIWALGKQFRAVGQELWDKHPEKSLCDRLDRLENIWSDHLSKPPFDEETPEKREAAFLRILGSYVETKLSGKGGNL